MNLYSKHLTKEQENILYGIYTIEQKLEKINKFQSMIHPLLHYKGMGNEHADIWREIEYTLRLQKTLKDRMQAELGVF